MNWNDDKKIMINYDWFSWPNVWLLNLSNYIIFWHANKLCGKSTIKTFIFSGAIGQCVPENVRIVHFMIQNVESFDMVALRLLWIDLYYYLHLWLLIFIVKSSWRVFVFIFNFISIWYRYKLSIMGKSIWCMPVLPF